MEQTIIKAKKIECRIGLLLLIPPILGVFAFVLQLFGADTFYRLQDLSSKWTGDDGVLIYLGLMAIAGVYLIKDSICYLFIKVERKQSVN